jgi:hypothetical protein
MASGEVMTFGNLLTSAGVWSVGPQGLREELAEGVPSVQMDLWRQLIPVLRMRGDTDVTVAAVGAGTRQGAAVERVRVKRGGLDVTLNIVPSTGRVHSTTFIDRGPGGEIGEFTIAFDDFRTVDGFTLPFKETATFNGAPEPTLTRTLDKISVNAPLDPALFSTSVAEKR